MLVENRPAIEPMGWEVLLSATDLESRLMNHKSPLPATEPGMNPYYFRWNAGNFTVMKFMWIEGKSASEIGRKIGCSRNAVLGQLHRHNLHKLLPRLSVPKCTVPPEKRPPQRKRVLPSPPVLKSRKAAELLRPARPPVAPDATLVSITEVTGCKWPMTAAPPHLFCNGERIDGRPYCAYHESRAINPLIKVRGKVRA